MNSLRLWPCKDIDFTWGDAFYALGRCMLPRAKPALLSSKFGEDSRILACLSVRSAFDLYLSARAFPQDSECIFIGVNVPEMLLLPTVHGLKVVGVDIDPISLTIGGDEIERAVTARTRFIVFPHLFGVRQHIDEIVTVAQRHNLDIVEDCAQSFDGNQWCGEAGATISLFSFGPLKTSSAIQGGIAVVRDAALYAQMEMLHSSYPEQSTSSYARRMARFLLIKVMSYAPVYGLVIRLITALGGDHEQLIHSLTRSIRRDSNLVNAIRLKPCGALISVMSRKLDFSDTHLDVRKAAGLELVQTLRASVTHAGTNATRNAYWAVVVLPSSATTLKQFLRKHGFDAMSSRLVAANPSQMPGAKVLEDSVMLPFTPRMPTSELRRQGALVSSYFEEIEQCGKTADNEASS